MSPEDLMWRRAVVLASVVLYWGGVFVHARRVRARIGRSPNVAARGARERWLWVGWALVVLSWFLQPIVVGGKTVWLGAGLDAPWLGFPGLIAGVVLVAAGYAGTLWCYAAMGEAWRMGVDREERTDLVTRGPYRWVRHPIYGLQGVMLLGVLLLLPTVWSLAVVVLHGVCVYGKVADEEAHLLTACGPSYREYRARTGRFLPRFGRSGRGR